MIKQVYKKDGFILIDNKNNIKMNYFIINNYDKIRNIDKLKKEYYKTKGFTYLN